MLGVVGVVFLVFGLVDFGGVSVGLWWINIYIGLLDVFGFV